MCDMRFIQRYHLERHKRVHSGEKPYQCDRCQQVRHKHTRNAYVWTKPEVLSFVLTKIAASLKWSYIISVLSHSQNFSRTDRLLRHRRMCVVGIPKEENTSCCEGRSYSQEPAQQSWSPLQANNSSSSSSRLAVWQFFKLPFSSMWARWTQHSTATRGRFTDPGNTGERLASDSVPSRYFF